MKIHISGASLRGVLSRIESQGDEVVDRAQAEHTLIESEKLPDVVLEHLGYFPKQVLEFFTLARWWDGENWSPQAVAGIPFPTLISGGLGPEVCMGSATIALPAKELQVFQNEVLKRLLSEGGHRGWVTVEFVGREVGGIHLGLPFYQWYNVLEAAGGYVGDFLAHPRSVSEFWVVSLVLARWPFPRELVAGRTSVEVPFQATKHFWPWGTMHEGLFSTPSTIVGVATNFYNGNLHRAANIAECSCEGFKLQGKIYLHDCLRGVEDRWKQARDSELV